MDSLTLVNFVCNWLLTVLFQLRSESQAIVPIVDPLMVFTILFSDRCMPTKVYRKLPQTKCLDVVL
jgi:hypothetical protein